MEIAPGIYQIQVPISDNPLGYSNSYIVEGENHWVMIDTGWDTREAFSTLESGVKSLGIELSEISTIIITHAHPDHLGLAGSIKRVSPKTKLFAHRREAELIDSRFFKFSEFQDEMTSMLHRHGVPQSEISSLTLASLPKPPLYNCFADI